MLIPLNQNQLTNDDIVSLSSEIYIQLMNETFIFQLSPINGQSTIEFSSGYRDTLAHGVHRN